MLRCVRSLIEPGRLKAEAGEETTREVQTALPRSSAYARELERRPCELRSSTDLASQNTSGDSELAGVGVPPANF